MEARKKTRGCLWLFAGCATAVILSVVLGIVALRTTFGRLEMRGMSMSPALVEGDLVLSRPAKEIRRGDLVVFVPPGNRGRFVQRVVALPGESVSMRNGMAFVNAMPLDEPYAWIDEEMPSQVTFRNLDPVRLSAGTFFVLGDNRDNANDSRFLGPIPREAIRGRVVYVLSPKNGPWKP